MTFFELQDKARRQTWLLIVYLTIAVTVIVVAANAAVYGSLVLADVVPNNLRYWLSQPIWIFVTLAIIATVIFGSLRKYLSLRGGGHALAEMMAARRIDFDSRDTHERRLINVVEEMSIASGTPVPSLYVMDDEGAINAFVAGFKPTEAVLVVTRGTIETLDRDQLQGVVGHEYSHILNGDMRLNIRLMAILAGILMIGSTGGTMLRLVFHSGHRRSQRSSFFSTSSSDRNRGGFVGGKVGIVMVVLGIALWLIGYIGLFLGRLIKAAVSRQREFLADASAVQFTRNSDGIAGALWTIRSHSAGSALLSPHAEDTSHMCFGEGVEMSLSSWLATHPPIESRVKALDPQFRAKMAALTIKSGQDAQREQAAKRQNSRPAGGGGVPGTAAGFAGFAGVAGGFEDGGRELDIRSSAEVVEKIGAPQPEHMAYAAALHAAMPAALMTATHVPDLAIALVYALVVANLDQDKSSVGLALIKHQAGDSTAEAAARLQTAVAGLSERFRLPALELAMPSLKRLSRQKKDTLIAVCEKLVKVDRKISVFEFALLTLLRKHLNEHADEDDRVKFFSYDAVNDEIARLLSLLAFVGADSPEAIAISFDKAVAGFGDHLSLCERDGCLPQTMVPVLERLAGLAPLLKRPLLEACVECIVHDQKVTVGESELLRAIAECLDCPMPPLAAGTVNP